MGRNFSVNHHFNYLAGGHRPSHRFSGNSRADWEKWHSELHALAIGTLGKMPRKVPLNPRVLAQWTEDGLIKRRIVFDVEEGLSATAYVFRPEQAKGKLPAIFACHGHVLSGKDSVMGNRSNPEFRKEIELYNGDYGLRMAQAGFVTIAIDWRGFGERGDRCRPHQQNLTDGRDPCNLHYLRATILGMTVLGMNVHDGMCALDYLCEHEEVDAERIGVMGLSFGGTMSTWLAICDPRIKAANIICYSDRFADFGMRDVNFCGSQITPGLYELCDVPDLHGLLAPRPLLTEIGTYDECFGLDSAMSCYHEVEKIYQAAGAKDRLELDLFEGGHQWGGNKSVAFFKRWLGVGNNGEARPAKEVAVTTTHHRTVYRDVDPDFAKGAS